MVEHSAAGCLRRDCRWTWLPGRRCARTTGSIRLITAARRTDRAGGSVRPGAPARGVPACRGTRRHRGCGMDRGNALAAGDRRWIGWSAEEFGRWEGGADRCKGGRGRSGASRDSAGLGIGRRTARAAGAAGGVGGSSPVACLFGLVKRRAPRRCQAAQRFVDERARVRGRQQPASSAQVPPASGGRLRGSARLALPVLCVCLAGRPPAPRAGAQPSLYCRNILHPADRPDNRGCSSTSRDAAPPRKDLVNIRKQ